MTGLPDLEGLAVFAKVGELRSFAGAAGDLGLSKATVSKAIGRLEKRLGTRLFNRTSRRLSLTEAGQQLIVRAARMLAEGEAAESEALAQSLQPRGRIKLAAPMSFGLERVAPLLPEFLAAYPEVTIDLHLADHMTDLIGEGFDAALRIATLSDSSLIAQKLCDVHTLLVASPRYLKQRGRPAHPLELSGHACLTYLLGRDSWQLSNAAGETVTMRPHGALRANNGDALLPAIVAGLGIAMLPDFILAKSLAAKKIEIVLPGWKPASSALYFVTPAGRPRPARIDALAKFFSKRLSMRPRKPHDAPK